MSEAGYCRVGGSGSLDKCLGVAVGSHLSRLFVQLGAAIGINGGTAQIGTSERVVERMGWRAGNS